METQTSVYRTSAPRTADRGSSENVSSAPVFSAISRQVFLSASPGWYSLGAQAVKRMPIFAQPIIRELPML